METKELKREIPAYLEYASDILANRMYRLMTLPERGLWDTMRKECWVNKCVPENADQLAMILNISRSDIDRYLTPNVLSFFTKKDGNLFCPELDDYKQKTLDRRLAMSKGGANGGRKTQSQIKESRQTLEATLQSTTKPLNRNEQSRYDKKGEESPIKDSLNHSQKEWVADYDNAIF